jgi:uncharacterized protein (DUF1697 family)
MANKFSLYFAMCRNKKLEKIQQMFVKHWNEKHCVMIRNKQEQKRLVLDSPTTANNDNDDQPATGRQTVF